jgi:hypothetical protein
MTAAVEAVEAARVGGGGAGGGGMPCLRRVFDARKKIG